MSKMGSDGGHGALSAAALRANQLKIAAVVACYFVIRCATHGVCGTGGTRAPPAAPSALLRRWRARPHRRLAAA
jgi:hypothetical protein